MSAVVADHVRRHGGRPASETQVWVDFGDDIFAIIDKLGDDLRKLRCVNVANTLGAQAPELMRIALSRAVQAWVDS